MGGSAGKAGGGASGAAGTAAGGAGNNSAGAGGVQFSAGGAGGGLTSWTQQNGPNRDAVIPGGFSASWTGAAPPPAWAATVGFGHAPVVVDAGVVYTFGLFKPGTKVADLNQPSSAPTRSEVRAGAKDPGDYPGKAAWDETHTVYRGDEYALALDEKTGAVKWATLLTDYGFAFTDHLVWVQASPLLINGRLYLHNERGLLFALDATDGHKLWDVNLFEHKMLFWSQKHSNASGPLAFGDTIIVSYMGTTDPYTVNARTTSPVVAAFDAATGAERWVTVVPLPCFRCVNSRLALAKIEGKDTLLVPGGRGTGAVDPATGALLWAYDAAGNDPKDEPAGRANTFPYSSYAPVASNDYVCDAVSDTHDQIDSRTWCLHVQGGKPTLAWVSNEMVQHTEVDKGNMIAKDGVLYGLDSRADMQAQFHDSVPIRGFRPKTLGRFQARDIATGKLLFSSDAFTAVANPTTIEEWYPTHSILAGDVLISIDRQALWFGRLAKDGLSLLGKVANPNNTACTPAATGAGCLTTSEPVLVNNRLYIRLLEADPAVGYTRPFAARGNLLVIDLGAR